MGACAFCGGPVPHPDDPSRRIYEMVEGWAEVRSQGGANALHGINRSGLLACGPCIRVDKAFQRSTHHQEGLL